MKHWTAYLDEVGTVYSHLGRDQEISMSRINEMKERLKQMLEQYEKEEKRIEEIAFSDNPEKGWTKEQIKKAKEDAQQEICKP